VLTKNKRSVKLTNKYEGIYLNGQAKHRRLTLIGLFYSQHKY